MVFAIFGTETVVDCEGDCEIPLEIDLTLKSKPIQFNPNIRPEAAAIVAAPKNSANNDEFGNLTGFAHVPDGKHTEMST